MQTVLLDLQKEIRKTIVFITHDRDEALRLGDRIAVLRDGEIVQQGTGQEIVLKPADDYIMNFVEHVNRGRVLRVESIMAPLDGALEGVSVEQGVRIDDAARLLLSSGAERLIVKGRDGSASGILTLEGIMAAMVSSADRKDATVLRPSGGRDASPH